MDQPIIVAGTFADLERAVREVCGQIDLLVQHVPEEEAAPTLSWRKRIFGACMRALCSMRLPVKGLDDELEEVEHMWMDRAAHSAAWTWEMKG
jgi:hypothetical protein